MGKPRTKTARRARAGDLGIRQTKRYFTGQHAKIEEKRANKAEQKRDLRELQDAATFEKPKEERIPRSFVFHRNDVGRFVSRLVRDVRHIMEPNTAKELKIRRSNNLRDFVVNGAPLGVSHLVVFTRGTKGLNLRLIRTPQGPTLTFRVHSYTLKQYVLRLQKKQIWCDQLFQVAPLIVMNGFKTDPPEKHLSVVQTMVQNMFPTINVDTVQIKTIRRCLMFNYDKKADIIHVRHYAIKTVPSGISKSAKKLATSRIPDLSKYNDIADFFENPGQLSESEWEDEQKDVMLPQTIHERGLGEGQTSNLRLIELGPRLTLQLIKVQEGLDDGEVMYHKFIQKSQNEIEKLRKRAPLIKKRKERAVKESEHKVIHRLKNVEERIKHEEEALREIREKAARKQAAVTGQTEDVEVNRKRDREIALEREREEGLLQKPKKGKSGGEGQNRVDEPPAKKSKKAPSSSQKKNLKKRTK